MDPSSPTADQLASRCPICLKDLNGNVLASPDSCEHVFCLTCILEWAKVANTCPVDRKQFGLVTEFDCAKAKPKRFVVPEPPLSFEWEQLSEEDLLSLPVEDTIICEVCLSGDNEERLLLCDGCNLGCHTNCLDPPLRSVPRGLWYCPTCSSAGLVSEYLMSRTARMPWKECSSAISPRLGQHTARRLAPRQNRAIAASKSIRRARRTLAKRPRPRKSRAKSVRSAKNRVKKSGLRLRSKKRTRTKKRGRRAFKRCSSSTRTKRSRTLNRTRTADAAPLSRTLRSHRIASVQTRRALGTVRSRIARNLGLCPPTSTTTSNGRTPVFRGTSASAPACRPQLSIFGSDHLACLDDPIDFAATQSRSQFAESWRPSSHPDLNSVLRPDSASAVVSCDIFLDRSPRGSERVVFKHRPPFVPRRLANNALVAAGGGTSPSDGEFDFLGSILDDQDTMLRHTDIANFQPRSCVGEGASRPGSGRIAFKLNRTNLSSSAAAPPGSAPSAHSSDHGSRTSVVAIGRVSHMDGRKPSKPGPTSTQQSNHREKRDREKRKRRKKAQSQSTFNIFDGDLTSESSDSQNERGDANDVDSSDAAPDTRSFVPVVGEAADIIPLPPGPDPTLSKSAEAIAPRSHRSTARIPVDEYDPECISSSDEGHGLSDIPIPEVNVENVPLPSVYDPGEPSSDIPLPDEQPTKQLHARSLNAEEDEESYDPDNVSTSSPEKPFDDSRDSPDLHSNAESEEEDNKQHVNDLQTDRRIVLQRDSASPPGELLDPTSSLHSDDGASDRDHALENGRNSRISESHLSARSDSLSKAGLCSPQSARSRSRSYGAVDGGKAREEPVAIMLDDSEDIDSDVIELTFGDKERIDRGLPIDEPMIIETVKPAPDPYGDRGLHSQSSGASNEQRAPSLSRNGRGGSSRRKEGARRKSASKSRSTSRTRTKGDSPPRERRVTKKLRSARRGKSRSRTPPRHQRRRSSRSRSTSASRRRKHRSRDRSNKSRSADDDKKRRRRSRDRSRRSRSTSRGRKGDSRRSASTDHRQLTGSRRKSRSPQRRTPDSTRKSDSRTRSSRASKRRSKSRSNRRTKRSTPPKGGRRVPSPSRSSKSPSRSPKRRRSRSKSRNRRRGTEQRPSHISRSPHAVRTPPLGGGDETFSGRYNMFEAFSSPSRSAPRSPSHTDSTTRPSAAKEAKASMDGPNVKHKKKHRTKSRQNRKKKKRRHVSSSSSVTSTSGSDADRAPMKKKKRKDKRKALLASEESVVPADAGSAHSSISATTLRKKDTHSSKVATKVKEEDAGPLVVGCDNVASESSTLKDDRKESPGQDRWVMRKVTHHEGKLAPAPFDGRPVELARPAASDRIVTIKKRKRDKSKASDVASSPAAPLSPHLHAGDAGAAPIDVEEHERADPNAYRKRRKHERGDERRKLRSVHDKDSPRYSNIRMSGDEIRKDDGDADDHLDSLHDPQDSTEPEERRKSHSHSKKKKRHKKEKSKSKGRLPSPPAPSEALCASLMSTLADVIPSSFASAAKDLPESTDEPPTVDEAATPEPRQPLDTSEQPSVPDSPKSDRCESLADSEKATEMDSVVSSDIDEESIKPPAECSIQTISSTSLDHKPGPVQEATENFADGRSSVSSLPLSPHSVETPDADINGPFDEWNRREGAAALDKNINRDSPPLAPPPKPPVRAAELLESLIASAEGDIAHQPRPPPVSTSDKLLKDNAGDEAYSPSMEVVDLDSEPEPDIDALADAFDDGRDGAPPQSVSKLDDELSEDERLPPPPVRKPVALIRTRRYEQAAEAAALVEVTEAQPLTNGHSVPTQPSHSSANVSTPQHDLLVNGGEPSLSLPSLFAKVKSPPRPTLPAINLNDIAADSDSPNADLPLGATAKTVTPSRSLPGVPSGVDEFDLAVGKVCGKEGTDPSNSIMKTSKSKEKSKKRQKYDSPVNPLANSSSSPIISGARMEEVVTSVKHSIKPYYTKGKLSKDQYKYIMRRCVPKVKARSVTKIVSQDKIDRLVKQYVDMVMQMAKKGQILI